MRFISDIFEPLKTTTTTLLVVVLGLIFSLSAQGQGWEQYYGNDAAEEANAIIQTIDQGYAIVGTTTTVTPGGFGIYVLRTDVDGTILWETEIDLPNTLEFGNSIVEDHDGNFVIAGEIGGGASGSRDVIVMKLDRLGNPVWPAPVTFGNTDIEDDDRAFDVIATQDGGYLVVGAYTVNDQEDFYMIKIDTDGNEEWQSNYGSSSKDILRAVVEAPNGDFIVVGSTGNNDDSDVYVSRRNNTGGLVWTSGPFGATTENDVGYDVIQASNGDFVVAGKTKNNGDYYIIRITEGGSPNGISIIGEDGQLEEARSIQQTKDGGFIIGGFAEDLPSPDIKASLLKIDADLNEVWTKKYGRDGVNIGNGLVLTPSGGYVLAGLTSTEIFINTTDVLLLKADADGEQVLTNIIRGNVFYDLANDCTFNNNEDGIKNWIVQAIGTEKTYYGISDAEGNYEIPVDTDSYVVSVVRPNEYWQACQPSANANFPETHDTLTRNFAINPQTNCTDLEVDVSTVFVEACEEAVYTITYCNHGTIEADDPVVELTLSKNLDYLDSAPFNVTYQSDSLYGFQVNDLDPGECGSFKVTTQASCDAILSETHSIKAHITPDVICEPVDPSWDNSSIAINGYCDGDSVRFEIKNKGTQAMQTALDYIVVEDIVMVLTEPDGPMLPAGGTINVARAADGSTKRLVVQQAEGHPGNSRPSIAVEGCIDGGGTDYSTGYHTQFPEDDADHFLAADCQENIPSTFDSQVKRGYPKGYGDSLKVASDTDFKYHIKFQNVGTDTAIRVVIRDTISPHLDPTTVRPGASSHDFDFEVYGDGILKFTFYNIMLPDSSTNETASHGFVKYRITQKPDNPEGTLIKNGAAVFFDYTAPMVTDSVCNYVAGPDWESFIITSDQNIYIPKTAIKVYPNPISQFATFEIEGLSLRPPFEFLIYDVTGKLVRSEQFYDTTFKMQRGNLPAGIFFYEIATKNQLIATGKIITQ